MESSIGVKFKPVGKIYYFECNEKELQDGDGVIVETGRGVEYGETALERKPSLVNEDDDQVVRRFIRKATEKDYVTLAQNIEKAYQYGNDAKKLIDSEVMFDNTKVVLTFTAEGRVDFRELVKELANKLKIRIELKQVGARDEAKIVGGLGPCGRPVCCANHMREFNKVSIKMAKTQGLALNPTKINGLCNRLMCCLAYEEDHYSQTIKEMPKIGKRVSTPDGEGAVIYNNLLKKLVTVRFTTEEGVVSQKEFASFDVKRMYVDEQQETNCIDCACPLKEQAEEKAEETNDETTE
ncbi:MAG: stage 0 sporulation protein [Tenericutes bacterium HGW-Tenericutes-4]|nr:MAG: stage 0 sporulation protein [Tenericutes bacterium HGW-Tenericutes-4]